MFIVTSYYFFNSEFPPPLTSTPSDLRKSRDTRAGREFPTAGRTLLSSVTVLPVCLSGRILTVFWATADQLLTQTRVKLRWQTLAAACSPTVTSGSLAGGCLSCRTAPDSVSGFFLRTGPSARVFRVLRFLSLSLILQLVGWLEMCFSQYHYCPVHHAK